MEDTSPHDSVLQNEENRFATFDGREFSVDARILAKAGFYYTKKANDVKCFDCNLKINMTCIGVSDDVIILHKEKCPQCRFAQKLFTFSKPKRSKAFISYDSLKLEEKRLETFIDWPVEWLTPSELAAEGFYYLRTEDHVACAFCRGILGFFEKGDTVRGEHRRHFPHCPFIRGQPVGNVPIKQCDILEGLKLSSLENAPQGCSVDVCGSKNMIRSDPDCRGQLTKTEALLDKLGFPQHCKPKHSDFLKTETRRESFDKWPDRVTQRPEDLAEAGFFYCGLSDHVRCFHCGNGLRNWEKDDIPWNEHAKWYPECNFVIIKKGKVFVDHVRREKTPYNHTATTITNQAGRVISDQDLDMMMESDIVKAVIKIGYPMSIARATLRNHIQNTGWPYLNIDLYIEDIERMIRETRAQSRQTSVEATGYDVSSRVSQRIQTMSLSSEPEQNSELEDNEGRISIPETSVEYIEALLGKRAEEEDSYVTPTQSSEEISNEPEQLYDLHMCKVCMDNKMDVVFLPCTHMVACASCAVVLTACPVCRSSIHFTVKPIVS
nr:MAG: baculoviral IAP repeat-containing protein [Marsupenaeus japonicus pemonivirus]